MNHKQRGSHRRDRSYPYMSYKSIGKYMKDRCMRKEMEREILECTCPLDADDPKCSQHGNTHGFCGYDGADPTGANIPKRPFTKAAASIRSKVFYP